MQVTITILPVSLSLIHIPRSRVSHLSHPILKQILQPNPTFLNITCNEIELSIFAEDDLLYDFEPIVRKDRHKQRVRAASSMTHSSAGPSTTFEPVEISPDRWSVLQIESHPDTSDDRRPEACVHELSAPLAEAGISILYQSSFTSDYMFVKEARLQEVMDIFKAAGLQAYSSDPTILSSGPQSPSDSSSLHDFGGFSPGGAILTRAPNSTHTSLSSTAEDAAKIHTNRDASKHSPSRKKSHSPTSGEVRLLPSDLTCVGLSSDSGIDYWGLKIIKLIAYPDLIVSASSGLPLSNITKYTTWANSVSQQVDSSDFEPCPPIAVDLRRSQSKSPSSSSSSFSDDDGYSPYSDSPLPLSPPSLPLTGSRSCSDLSNPTSISAFKLDSKHSKASVSSIRAGTSLTINTKTSSQHQPANDTVRVPFFSFTRTTEGASLTADVYLLASLFPPHERHMVYGSDILDVADQRLNGDSSDEEDADHYYYEQFLTRSLKCLQIDLRRFGLDKYGLVNRFSQVLEDNGIHLMYSSTFKTANLLVDKKHALRAQYLLSTC